MRAPAQLEDRDTVPLDDRSHPECFIEFGRASDVGHLRVT